MMLSSGHVCRIHTHFKYRFLNAPTISCAWFMRCTFHLLLRRVMTATWSKHTQEYTDHSYIWFKGSVCSACSVISDYLTNKVACISLWSKKIGFDQCSPPNKRSLKSQHVCSDVLNTSTSIAKHKARVQPSAEPQHELFQRTSVYASVAICPLKQLKNMVVSASASTV